MSTESRGDVPASLPPTDQNVSDGRLRTPGRDSLLGGISQPHQHLGVLWRTFVAAVSTAPARVALLAVAAALVWIAHYERWSPESWQIPTDYYVDAHETLARIKAASEGDIWPLGSIEISRLGAPFGASWNSYPTPDKPLMLVLGGIANIVGLFAAANFGLVLAAVSAALAFYFVARWLRYRWEWAAAGALLFAYTYHTVHRGLSHYSLVFTWTVPLGLFAVWLVAGSRRLEWKRPEAIVCLLAGAVLGVSNPYNLYFWLQLMVWAAVIQWFGQRRRINLQIAGATIATALLAFAIVHAERWLYVEDSGGLSLLARNYAGTEIYALKPVEMFIPPIYHQWDALAFFGHRYTRWSAWRGEAFLPYLGLVGIAGFIWLAVASVRRIIERRALPGHALSVGWIIAYATVGGVTNLLALFAGFQIFRATNRAAVFISALVLFFLVGRLSRLSAAWPAWVRFGAAALIAGFGVFEQLPRREPAHDREAVVAAVQSDRELARALEAALPDGAMIFQLPVLGFPEVATPHVLNDYEHFRPYLATSTLRFSYGAAKMRAPSRWQEDLKGKPTREIVRRLEQYGFAALYINRKGYKDGAASVLGELDTLGYTKRVEGKLGNQVVVFLNPVADPRPPLGESLTFGQGWHLQSDAGVRWAYEDAALSYHNPYDRPTAFDLKLTMVAASPRTVVLQLADQPVVTLEVGTEAKTISLPGVRLAPGVNCFMMHSPHPASRQGQGPNQLRSFGLRDSTVALSRERTPSVAVVPAKKTAAD